MIKKLREEKSLEKAEEERKLRKQIEMAKSANQKTSLAIEFIKKGSDLVNRNDYDPAIELYEKARSIFKEIKAPTEVKKVEESIANIQEEKEKYYIKLEYEERERLRIEEGKKQQEEMIKKLREEKSLEKAEEERILQKQIEMAKSANQKTALALEFIKKGSDLVNRNDYDSAIELYEKARSIFKEIKAPTEVKKVEESIISIREDKQKYHNKLEFEEKERMRVEEEKKQQEEMIRKIREEKALQKAEEERILQKQIEMAKSANQKTALALEFIKKGSELVNRNDYDPAIELYEKARSIFMEIKAPTEMKKVEESIISIREDKQKYYNKLEFEERERSRIEEENKQQEEMIRKIREEKALQRAEEEQILQKQIEMAKSANQKTSLALEFIKKGSELVFQNEYDSAIEIYKKAREIFKEIKAPTEVKKVEESIASILDDKQKYFNKLEFEERERLRIEEEKNQQEEMIRKLREEKALQKAEEEQLLQKQIEKAKSVDQKTSLALEFIKKGSDLVNRNEHDSAIELYEKARAIFKEIKAPTEVKKVEESIVSIREVKQNYHDKLELEERERLRIEEEKKQQEELIRKFREEKAKQKVKEEENLRKERENAKKYKGKSKIAYNLIEEGSNLVKNHEYKKAIEIYQKSLSIFEKIGFKTEVRRIKDSIVSIKIEKEKFLVKLETEKIENTKIQEAQQKEIELLKIFRHDEENRKAEQSRRLRIELEKAKTKEEKTKAAYSFIERGTDLTRLNDFDSAITDYESALQIFEEIVSVTEAAKVKDSLKSLHKEKIAYLAKLQKEKLEKEKFKEAKRKEEDLIKKLQEEAEKRKAAERRRLQAELEAAQTTESKRKTAFNYIEYGTNLVKTHDFDEAIEYYKKALIVYEEVDSISEAIKVRESLGAIQAEKNNYLSKLETERVERKRKEQEKYRDGELFKKAEEEKRRRAEEDSKRLQREIGKAQKVEEKIDVALDLLDKGSELLEQNEFDGATDYYNKAQKLFIEVGATTEAERVKESLTSISINKDKFLLKIKQGELKKERKEEAERKERELIERLRLEEEQRKNAESEKLRIEMNTVKTKEEKFKAAYSLIEQGTALINQNNDYDTAINYYEKALVIFEEINSSIEISRIKESLLRLHADKKAYILKIERERQYKKKMEETKNREDKLLRRLKEEEIKRKTAELEKLNIELEVAKTKEEKSKAGYNYIEQGSILINQNDYDTAIEYYEKALSIFTEIEAVVEITKVKASLLSIQAQKIGYLARLEREKIQAARLEESERRERDLIEKLKSEENKRKIAENIRLKLELEAAKTKDEKITAAYGYIEQGSVLVDKNDYDTAINYYEKALSIFDEIGSISESAKIKESLVSLTIEKKSYLSKLEKARIERKKLEEDKIQEEDLLRKIKEEEKRRKVAEKEKLRLELENAKTTQEKTQSGYNYLEKGSELAGQHDYDVAIEHYKEALLIFEEIDSKTEVLKINESISNLIVEKKNYIEKLKKESLEKERREEEKVKERELLKQIEEERMRKAKEVSEKMKKEVKAARSREEKTNLAYQFLERGSELIKQEKEFDSAIELYIKAKSLFEEIKSKTEALRVEDSVKSLKIQKEKHYLKLEKERIEKENLEEMKRKDEDLIRIKQEEDLKRKEEEEQKYLKQVEEAHSRREKANIAYELLEKGSELVDLYEYDKGLESYEKAFKLLKEIGSSTECNKVKESIKVIESEKKQYMLKLEQEKANKKKREEIQINLEKLIRQRIGEENERKREEELRLRQEIEEAKDKESKTKIAYKLIQQGTVLAENDDYDSGIELYIKAQRIFEQIGSKTEIQKVEEGIGDIRAKKRKYLVKIQNIKFEGERFEQIQLETKSLISKIEAEKNSIKQAETEKLRNRLESVKNNEELGKFAYDCIENSNNFIEEKEFEKALEELKKGMELFNLIGWKIEANRTEEEIDKTKERWESYLKNLEKTKILEEQKRRESEEFKKRINEEKKQLEAEYKIREMEKRKETAEKLHIVKIQNEAAEILKKGSELTRNGDFKQAEIQFNEALKLFESVKPEIIKEISEKDDFEFHTSQ